MSNWDFDKIYKELSRTPNPVQEAIDGLWIWKIKGENAMDKFKIGDKVRVRSDLIVGKKYGNITMLDGAMERHIGSIGTINGINFDGGFHLDIGYYWSEEMLEPLCKFKVGDKVVGNDKANERYSITKKGWVGEVTSVNKDGSTIWVTGVGVINCPVDVSCFDLYKPASNNKIVITTDGKVTTASLYNGKEKIKTAKSSCHPEDTFDFNTGAKIAFDNLIGEADEEPKVKPKKLLKNGMFVLNHDNSWYMVVDDKFIGVDKYNGFNVLSDYDDDLYYVKDSSYGYKAIVEAQSIYYAKYKYKNGDVVWKRTK